MALGSNVLSETCAFDPHWWRAAVGFETHEPGYGASTRNAGYVGRSIKHGFGEMIEADGLVFAMPFMAAATRISVSWRSGCIPDSYGYFRN